MPLEPDRRPSSPTPQGAKPTPLWPYQRVDNDRLQEALERLSAVSQYLYDTMNGDEESDRDTPDPLPTVAMESVRAAQVAIDQAIRLGSRRDRRKVGLSDLTLVEHLGRREEGAPHG